MLYVKTVFAFISFSEGITEYRSALFTTLGEYEVFYRPNEWVLPNDLRTRLFVWRDLPTAMLNMPEGGRATIEQKAYVGVMHWWCEVRDPIIPIDSVLYGPSPDNIEKWWERYPYNNYRQYPFFNKPPQGYFAGVRMVTAVKLISPIVDLDLEQIAYRTKEG